MPKTRSAVNPDWYHLRKLKGGTAYLRIRANIESFKYKQSYSKTDEEMNIINITQGKREAINLKKK